MFTEQGWALTHTNSHCFQRNTKTRIYPYVYRETLFKLYWIFNTLAFMEQKLHFKFWFLISNRSCKWTFWNIFPHQKLCFRSSFLLTSFTVKTAQDCLLYLLSRIYCVSANWSSRLRNHFAPVCLQSDHTPGSASGDGLKNRLSAAYRNKRPSKWRYTIWSHV